MSETSGPEPFQRLLDVLQYRPCYFAVLGGYLYLQPDHPLYPGETPPVVNELTPGPSEAQNPASEPDGSR